MKLTTHVERKQGRFREVYEFEVEVTKKHARPGDGKVCLTAYRLLREDIGMGSVEPPIIPLDVAEEAEADLRQAAAMAFVPCSKHLDLIRIQGSIHV